MGRKKQETVLKKGASGRGKARIDEVREKDIIGTVFGDILQQHSKINRKNMTWNKGDGTKWRALMFISDRTVLCVCVCVCLNASKPYWWECMPTLFECTCVFMPVTVSGWMAALNAHTFCLYAFYVYVCHKCVCLPFSCECVCVCSLWNRGSVSAVVCPQWACL